MVRGGASLAAAASCPRVFAAVRYLVLERNRIGEAGMRALAEAIEAHDAFASCTTRRRSVGLSGCCIFLMDNPASAELVHCAVESRRRKAGVTL